MALRPKNWERFQHYKQRCPPWIKVYRTLLDDRDFMCLPVASKALAMMLWLLASEHAEGVIEGVPADWAFRLRMTDNELLVALKPLIDNGMFADASMMLAECLQSACPETENREREESKSKPPFIPPKGGETVTKVERKAKATRLPADWAYDIKHEALATEMGVSLYEEFVKFKDYFIGEGKLKADWNRTFNNWLRTAGERRNRTTTWSRK
jgi:hypothetical protein